MTALPALITVEQFRQWPKGRETVMELPYRPVSEFELRAADVATVSHNRWEAADSVDDLFGAPDLAVYGAGEEIPLEAFGGQHFPVAEIFTDKS
jgi:hypothetical protein